VSRIFPSSEAFSFLLPRGADLVLLAQALHYHRLHSSAYPLPSWRHRDSQRLRHWSPHRCDLDVQRLQGREQLAGGARSHLPRALNLRGRRDEAFVRSRRAQSLRRLVLSFLRPRRIALLPHSFPPQPRRRPRTAPHLPRESRARCASLRQARCRRFLRSSSFEACDMGRKGDAADVLVREDGIDNR
jgi:hypothetical protein